MKFIIWCALFAGLVSSSAQAQTAPTLVSISNSQTLMQGDSVSLAVSVNGTFPFTYQWKKGGVPISGATASTYTITPLAITDAGAYTVVVTNAGGSITSGIILIDVTPATPPTFTVQPGNVIHHAGDDINLYASVSGTSPLTYVWKKDGVLVATTSYYYYSKYNVQVTDGGIYTVTASNAAGSVTSGPFIVTVNPLTAPVITTQPSSNSIYAGGTAWLQVNLERTNGVNVQWYRDGEPIPGANSYSYQATTAGSYTVKATNSMGTSTSAAAVITIVASGAPTGVSISSGPLKVTLGTSFSLYASASGVNPLSYQWRKDGVDIVGATAYSYYKGSATVDDTGTYSVLVSNSAGRAVSGGTTVSIAGPLAPLVNVHPAPINTYPGGYASLSVSATGTGNLTFQWKKDGAAVPGATNSNYTVTSSAASSDSGVYTVIVSNAYGSVTSEPATVTVLSAVAPAITTQPAGASRDFGDGLNLSVQALGYPSPTFQWRKDGMDIPGATNSYYSRSNVASSDSGAYTVVVSNSAGTVTSQPAVVTVAAMVAPKIIQHPASASLLAGSSFGGLTVAYLKPYSGLNSVKWYRNNVEIAGFTGDTYYISNAQPSQAGTYKAIVTNASGSTTSFESVVTVDLSSARPVITSVSGSRAVTGGASVYLDISIAPGVGSYVIQWKKDGVTIPNAYSEGLSFSSFGPTMAGTYTAEVTTLTGIHVSQPIVLGLLNGTEPPRVTSQPSSISQFVGRTAWFSVEVDGLAPLSYQWKKGGIDIPGGTSSQYYISNVVAAHAGSYTVVITNANGSASSAVATLTVGTPAGPPVFSFQPASQSLSSNYPYLNLNVGLLNSTGIETYQWYKDEVAIPGAIYGYLNLYSSSSSHAGSYKVVVTNPAGSSTSGSAVVSVVMPAMAPTFVSQPIDRAGHLGGYVTFNATATGSPTITYQWRKNGAIIGGATDSTLTLTNLQAGDAASYSVLATNQGGTTVSSTAALTLGSRRVITDINGDHKTDIIWQNTLTGERKLWLMNGTTNTGDSALGVIALEWKIVGSGDFDGNGTPDLLWENSITGERYVWFMTGSSISGRASLGFVPVEWKIGAVGDFNADSQPDLVWQNTITGERTIWLMNGTAQSGNAALGNLALEWRIVGTGDFDGDSRTDLVWENAMSGERYVWLMNGTSMRYGLSLGIVGTEWKIGAVGDYDGDGRPDLAWQNMATGQCVIWRMNGLINTGSVGIGIVPLEWQLGSAARSEPTAADFNGDGQSDLAWQNTTTGERRIWAMNGTAHTGDLVLGSVPVEWNLVGTGDFDGNGSADLLWENTVTGYRHIWFMNGSTVSSQASLGYVPTEWRIGAVGDFDGDGQSDLVWQNTSTGERRIWLLNGTNIASNLGLGTVAVEWSIAGTGDFDGNGTADLVWENTVTGERYVWFMNGTVNTGGASLGVAGTDWRIGAVGDYNRDGHPDLAWQNFATGQCLLWLMDGTTMARSVELETVPVVWRLKL